MVLKTKEYVGKTILLVSIFEAKYVIDAPPKKALNWLMMETFKMKMLAAPLPSRDMKLVVNKRIIVCIKTISTLTKKVAISLL